MYLNIYLSLFVYIGPEKPQWGTRGQLSIHFLHFNSFFSYSTVSNLALSEYENLHSKFEVEKSCRNKAEEFATNVSHYYFVHNKLS